MYNWRNQLPISFDFNFNFKAFKVSFDIFLVSDILSTNLCCSLSNTRRTVWFSLWLLYCIVFKSCFVKCTFGRWVQNIYNATEQTEAYFQMILRVDFVRLRAILQQQTEELLTHCRDTMGTIKTGSVCAVLKFAPKTLLPYLRCWTFKDLAHISRMHSDTFSIPNYHTIIYSPCHCLNLGQF